MKHLIIGTAGHVDHGKTQLTLALTGKNTDRLVEEQKRGITIEIGFAQLVLPNGQMASIVDVPGHEKFIRNMLVGASGVDVVLMIVAADEGFMPQTQEHLEILSLLGVQNGIIVMTKTDLVEEEWLELMMEETREKVAGTFLENAPIMPVSAYTGEGIEALKQEIVRLVERTPEKVSDRPFRLPIDRVFSLSGYGAIVTGTLVDGTIDVGQNVMLYPHERMVRVRELQNHDTNVASVSAGMRVAVNLSGISKKELSRGAILAEPDSMQLSRMIAVHLVLNEDAPYSVKNSSQLHFYQGTQELLCKVRLLETDEMLPGESGYAQLQFTEPLAARNTDKFILRFYSPMTTVGGGVILDMDTKRLKRHSQPVLERLAALHASAEERILQMVKDAGCCLIEREVLMKRSGLSVLEVQQVLTRLLDQGKILTIQKGLIADSVIHETWESICSTLETYHSLNPLSSGMHLGELREKIFPGVPQKAADAVLDRYCGEGKLRLTGPTAALSGHEICFTPEQTAMQKELIKLYEGYGFAPLTNEEVAGEFSGRSTLYQQVFHRMCQDGELMQLTPQTVVLPEVYRKAKEIFIGMFAEKDTVTLADFRTALGVSRKYAMLFLDEFDRQKISKLVGDARVLLLK